MADYSMDKIPEYLEALERMKENAPFDFAQPDVIRNFDDLKLEELTEDVFIEQYLSMGAELGVDVRQGSVYWDASMGSIIRTSMLVHQLSKVKELISIKTCTGDILDERLFERALTRNPPKATPAIYYVEFVGEIPVVGSVMTCEGHFFTLQKSGEDYVLVSSELGVELNDLAPGMRVIPDIDVDGLVSAKLGNLAVPAIDIEEDDSARERLINKVSGPDENGNRSQVKTWCESVEGVGRARIISLWNGPNTVKGVIIAKDGGVPALGVVAAVQKYLDPGATGMGEGVCTIGQFFTAAAAEPVVINISVSVLKRAEATYSGIEEDFKELLTNYIKDMALEEFNPSIAIRYVRVGALLEGLEDVIDYDNLTLNGTSENITFTILQVPVLGEVTIDGDI